MSIDELYEPHYSRSPRMPQKRVGTAPPPLAARPKCPECGKALRPRMEVEDWGTLIKGKERPRIVRWTGEYDGYEFFDTLRCAAAFANKVVRSRRAPAP